MNKYLDNTIKAFYIAVPFSCSIFSAYHLIDFVALANNNTVAIFIAIILEIASLSCIFGLVTLDKIDKQLLWTTFWIVTFFQTLGNCYAAYNFLFIKIEENETYLSSFKEMMLNINNIALKFILSFLLGSLMPVLSVLQSKSLAKYLENTKDKALEEKEANVNLANPELELDSKLANLKEELLNLSISDNEEVNNKIESVINKLTDLETNAVSRNKTFQLTVQQASGTNTYKALIN
jgi:hypothetical protein